MLRKMTPLKELPSWQCCQCCSEDTEGLAGWAAPEQVP